jgi:hypothetical protein
MSIKSVNPYVRNIKTFEEITDDQAAQLIFAHDAFNEWKKQITKNELLY